MQKVTVHIIKQLRDLVVYLQRDRVAREQRNCDNRRNETLGRSREPDKGDCTPLLFRFHSATERAKAIVSIAPADRKSPVSRYILADETFTIVTTANAIPFVRRAVANFFTALCM